MGLFDYFKKKKQLKHKKEYEDRMEEKGWIDCMIIGDQTNTQWSKDTDGKIIEISNKRMGGDSKDSEENFNLEKPTISYYENGQKQIEGTYKDGEIISSKEWNEDGSVKE